MNPQERNQRSQRASEPEMDTLDPDLDFLLEAEPVVFHLLDLGWT
jgi:hypothetical protein